jgi:hypothetical protein
MDAEERRAHEERLLASIKREIDALTQLLAHAQQSWNAEDFVYRYYHHSFKVFGIQRLTEAIVEKLRALLPECPLNTRFARIVENGTGKIFTDEMNATWEESTRPLLEAYFHAHYFLSMAVKYGNQLDELPATLPSGWAALLYLYNIR